mmetsp:Transcript_11527/g.30085  ORF Transcript_11527/g.30085 Transcript_11527/m.30085 type:complete len:297 (+) Transcript_11527:541-1431(+)
MVSALSKPPNKQAVFVASMAASSKRAGTPTTHFVAAPAWPSRNASASSRSLRTTSADTSEAATRFGSAGILRVVVCVSFSDSPADTRRISLGVASLAKTRFTREQTDAACTPSRICSASLPTTATIPRPSSSRKATLPALSTGSVSSSPSIKQTTEGVKPGGSNLGAPSASTTAAAEFVVPRSKPTVRPNLVFDEVLPACVASELFPTSQLYISSRWPSKSSVFNAWKASTSSSSTVGILSTSNSSTGASPRAVAANASAARASNATGVCSFSKTFPHSSTDANIDLDAASSLPAN